MSGCGAGLPSLPAASGSQFPLLRFTASIQGASGENEITRKVEPSGGGSRGILSPAGAVSRAERALPERRTWGCSVTRQQLFTWRDGQRLSGVGVQGLSRELGGAHLHPVPHGRVEDARRCAVGQHHRPAGGIVGGHDPPHGALGGVELLPHAGQLER